MFKVSNFTKSNLNVKLNYIKVLPYLVNGQYQKDYFANFAIIDEKDFGLNSPI